MESNRKFRSLCFVTLAFLPLAFNLLAGSARGASLALYPASATIFYLLLPRLEKTGWPLFGINAPGINLRNLGLAIFVFVPTLLKLPVGTPLDNALALFAASVAAFYFVLQRLEMARWQWFSIAASLAVVFAALNAAYIQFVGVSVGYQVFASVLDTNGLEFSSTLTSPFLRNYSLALGGLLVLAGGLSRLTRDVVVGCKVLPSQLIKALAIAVWLSTALNLSRSKFSVTDFYPCREVYQLCSYLTEVRSFVGAYRGLEYKFEGNLNPDKTCTAILVIGEAARKDKLGIYGSGLDTTPCLDRFAMEHPDRLLLYARAVSASAYTRVSVPSLLSVCTARDYAQIAHHPSILKIMKAAGLETALISNQTRRGFHDDFVSTIMADATRKTYLKESLGHVPDESLIAPLLAELTHPTARSKLIIVHLDGSHFPYLVRCPQNQMFLPPSSIENQYLNSLRYTDSILQRIMDAMKQAQQPVVMFYTSDHGEYLNDYQDGFYDHGNRNHLTRFEIEVPFYLTVNESFQHSHSAEMAGMRQHTQLPVSHDNVSHTLLGLMGIFTAAYRPDLDLAAPGFTAGQRFIVERTNKVSLLENVRFDQTRFYGLKR